MLGFFPYVFDDRSIYLSRVVLYFSYLPDLIVYLASPYFVTSVTVEVDLFVLAMGGERSAGAER